MAESPSARGQNEKATAEISSAKREKERGTVNVLFDPTLNSIVHSSVIVIVTDHTSPIP